MLSLGRLEVWIFSPRGVTVALPSSLLLLIYIEKVLGCSVDGPRVWLVRMNLRILLILHGRHHVDLICGAVKIGALLRI